MARTAAAAGVDGCPAGWVRVWRYPEGDLQVAVFPDVRSLLADQRHFAAIAVDMPIGLSTDGPRACDVDARQRLGPRRSSVFPAPVRAVLGARSYADACRRSVRVSGRALSLQAWHLVPRIADLDRVLRGAPALQRRVREVHPELCFATMHGGEPMAYPKRHPLGRDARRRLVARHVGPGYERLLASLRRRDVKPDDLLDAMALLWTAERMRDGSAWSIPAHAERDVHGLRMAITA